MPFFLRAAGWIGLHVAAIIAGAFLGAMLSPKVNPHNDWGTTSLLYSLVGAFIGSSSVIVLLIWRSEMRMQARSRGDSDLRNSVSACDA